jgi:hypothetical protein
MGTAVLVYGLLAASGTLWALLAGRSPLWLETEEAWLGTWLPSPLVRSVLSLLLGVSVALMAVRGTRVLVQRTAWAKSACTSSCAAWWAPSRAPRSPSSR